MTGTVVVDVVESIVTILNAATLSIPFVATRDYLHHYDRSDLEPIQVLVVPEILEVSAWDLRPRRSWDWGIAIWIDYLFEVGTDGQLDPTVIDPVMTLVQEVIDLFPPGDVPANTPNSRLIHAENEPVYDPEEFDQFRVFSTKVLLTFRTTR